MPNWCEVLKYSLGRTCNEAWNSLWNNVAHAEHERCLMTWIGQMQFIVKYLMKLLWERYKIEIDQNLGSNNERFRRNSDLKTKDIMGIPGSITLCFQGYELSQEHFMIIPHLPLWSQFTKLTLREFLSRWKRSNKRNSITPFVKRGNDRSLMASFIVLLFYSPSSFPHIIIKYPRWPQNRQNTNKKKASLSL